MWKVFIYDTKRNKRKSHVKKENIHIKGQTEENINSDKKGDTTTQNRKDHIHSICWKHKESSA